MASYGLTPIRDSLETMHMEQDNIQPTPPSDILEPIRAAQQQWSAENLQRAAQQAVQYTTSSDISLVPLATPLDWPLFTKCH